jgi:GT2 family glycosyltransferase
MVTSVLIPSFGRPPALVRCLRALSVQTQRADQVIVVWQGLDTATRDAAIAMKSELGEALMVVHLPEPGIVPAENAALSIAIGEIILMIDDDAVAASDWLQKHVAFYEDPSVGAVGGPGINRFSDGTSFPQRAAEPTGLLTFFGKVHGNMHDHPSSWRTRPPRAAHHLVGYNMSLRRSTFDRFEENLRSYWQLFEMEVCLQVRRRGFKIVFDYSNVIDHFPSNTAYVADRTGDLAIKVYNSAYNHAFILGKHARPWQWPAILAYLLLVGNSNQTGIMGSVVSIYRRGNPGLEVRILFKTLASRLSGFRDGLRARR